MSVRKSLFLSFAAVVAFSCVPGGFGRNPTRLSTTKGHVESLPFVSTALPYAGYGSVTLLDEGSLIISAGVDGRWEEAAGGGFGVVPLEVVAVTLDTTGLSLIELGKESFLDRNGLELVRHELAEEEVSRIPVAGRRDSTVTPTPDAVAEFVGVLYLSIDPSSRYLSVTVSELGDNPRAFHADLALSNLAPAEPALAEVQSEDPRLAAAIQIVRNVTTDGNVAGTTCDAACTLGTCHISCPQACKAWCSSSGVPHCQCVAQ